MMVFFIIIRTVFLVLSPKLFLFMYLIIISFVKKNESENKVIDVFEFLIFFYLSIERRAIFSFRVLRLAH